MNSFRPNRSRKRLFIATIIVLGLYLADIFTGGSIRGIVRTAGSFVWKSGQAAGDTISNSGYFSARRSLMEENAALREQISRLEERSAAYQVLVEENKSLREMTRAASLGVGVTAPVISSFRASPYGTFLIGAGSADGISPGDIVLSSENFVIGRVAESAAENSLVRELFAAGVETDAILADTGVTVEGSGGGNAKANLSREVSISEGNAVVSPIFGGRAIGIVGAIEEDQVRGLKSAYIRLPLNLSSLKFVYVVKK